MMFSRLSRGGVVLLPFIIVMGCGRRDASQPSTTSEVQFTARAHPG